jgi:hypothetical protein
MTQALYAHVNNKRKKKNNTKKEKNKMKIQIFQSHPLSKK